MKFLSLFSGCGGFDLGFSGAGYKPIYGVDNNKYCHDVYKSNLKSECYLHDLSTASLPAAPGKVDVMIAGPPCQGFSTAGKRDFDDPRNHLLTVTGEIALKVLPKVIVIENVSGVISGEHRSYWENVKEGLVSKRYKVTETKCEGDKMGLSQQRKRYLMIAWKGNKEVDINIPTTPGGTLWDVLRGVEGLHNHNPKFIDNNSDMHIIAEKIAPGQKLSNVRSGEQAVHTWYIPEVFGSTTAYEKVILESLLRIRRRLRIRKNGDADPVPEEVLQAAFGKSVLPVLRNLVSKGYVKLKDGHYDLTNTFNGKYRRLQWDKPSFTVDTRFGNPRYFLHPEEHRGFSVREAARIQGFADNIIFSGSEREQYRMIGNAVPPPMAFIVANYINEVFFK